MRNFINDHILKYFGWTIWQLLSFNGDGWYFDNWLIERIDRTPLVTVDWNYSEVWIDPMLSPPYVLVLMGVDTGACSVFNPAEGYKVIKSFASCEEARLWLMEDEYEVVGSRPIPPVIPEIRPTISVDIPERVIERIKNIVVEVLETEFKAGRLF